MRQISIVDGLLQSCSVSERPSFPFQKKEAIITAVQTVVDGFCGSESLSPQIQKQSKTGVRDVLKIFRADRVFKFILQIHLQIEASYNPRHRRNWLAGLECIIDIIQENLKVPSTCRYLLHIILQSLEIDELQEQCCSILKTILNTLSSLPSQECSAVLGPQLQLIVWYLVSACTNLSKRDDIGSVTDSLVFSLLEQVTVNAAPTLHPYIQELSPFPDLPMFGRMQELCLRISARSDKAHGLTKFVMQTRELPPFLLLKSLQNLHRTISRATDNVVPNNGCLQSSIDSQAALMLVRSVRQCFDSNADELVDIAGGIIAKMGVGDPDAVTFSLPCYDGIADLSSTFSWGGTECGGTQMNCSVSDDFLRAILVQLKNYLFDEHALVIELSVQTLKGLLSTEKGCRVSKSMEANDSMYLSVFARGVNQRLVEDLLNVMKTESIKKSIPLENDALWEVSGKPYNDWVCLLVYSLSHYCEDTILRLCQGVIRCKSFLAESLLPYILGSLAASSGVNSNICNLISCQVEKHIFSSKNNNTRSLQLFLNALNELRRCNIFARMKQGQDAKGAGKSKVYWLNLDYLQTASIAQKCGAYFTSVLYVEHWCEEKFGKLSLGEPDFSDEEELPLHIELLLTIYTQINEPDGVYGVVRSHKLLPRVLLHEHEGDWSKAVGSYDLLLRNRDLGLPLVEENDVVADRPTIGKWISPGRRTDWHYNKGLMKSLQRTGCEHVLKMYCRGLALEKGSLERDIEFQELQYESAWRAGKWDFYYASPRAEHDLCPVLEIPKIANFHSNLFWCLRSLHEGDSEQFSYRMACAKQELIKFISLISLESTGNIFPTIIRLQILDFLNSTWSLRWQKDGVNSGRLLGPFTPSTEQLAIMDAEWQRRLTHMQYQFDLFEPFVAFHTTLLKVLECKNCLPQQLLEFATFARKAGRLNQAAAAIHELKQHYNQNRSSIQNIESNVISAARKVEEAKILWAQGQQQMAVSLLKYVISHHDVQDDSGTVYCLTGKWLAETRSDSARIILTQYLQRAVQLFDKAEMKDSSAFIERRSRAYYRMAHFTDCLYQSYEERLNSSEWKAALRLRTHKSKEAEVLARRIKQAGQKEAIKKGTTVSRFQDGRIDLTRKYLELQKQLAMDNEEAQRLESDKESFLLIALNSYRQCLTTNDKYDLRVVFRIMSLWFNLSMNQGVVKSMLETVNQVKSYKFLPLVYQIASRLGPLKESQGVLSFQYVLTCLVKKLATEHPYHSVNQLFALANGDRVKDKQRNKTAFVIDIDKKQAAEALLNALTSVNKDLIEQMKQLVEIYIRLAEIEVKKDDMGKRVPLPRDIRGIRQLALVPVITAEIPVARNAEYPEGCFPYFIGLSDRFLVMHGINAPKVVECHGSDGQEYRQLAKSGDDDLRQDAVMEQLFSLVNMLLQHHPDTRKRRLGIRTYKVVPFTPSAGVLEWVNGTMPLGEYLMGSDRKGGAHARHGLGDWTFPACREHLEKEEDKHKAFQKVCQNFRPVFHNFFLEKFSHPAEWFKRRLAYTRSVAASSMVGYVVGLGDRHSMNILLDQESAEVVHIDLGVAFEQGKMLKMPERVPFRLTRDIVDGMGVTGVEGVFRRCCEETLSVMRANKDALLTIIEVFIHDPLYKWALSPLKALQRQQETIEFDEYKEDIADLESASGENKDAARALMRIKQKLDGYEGGDMRSIQGQVQQLIQDAQDSEKLCQMFPGWAAWL